MLIKIFFVSYACFVLIAAAKECNSCDQFSSDDFDPYMLETASLPTNFKFNPTVANGFLGHRIYSDTIYKNGLYNGAKGDSHRARIPSTLPVFSAEDVTLNIDGDDSKQWRTETCYKLDLRDGVFYQIVNVFSGNSSNLLCTVTQKFYAHKLITRLLVSEIIISLESKGSVIVKLSSNAGKPTSDINFSTHGKKKFNDKKGKKVSDNLRKALWSCGKTITTEEVNSKHIQVCLMHTDIPKNITLQSETFEAKTASYIFLTSIDNNYDETMQYYLLGVKGQYEGILYSSHREEWKNTWGNGLMTLGSESKFQMQSVKSGLYYLLSAFPPTNSQIYPYEFYGASPGGLTNGGEGEDYLGHVFWDQDFWMLPALLPFHHGKLSFI